MSNLYKEIKVFCSDIDGTLSDGIFQISESGEITKSFYTRDFHAIEQLLRADLTVIIMTQSHDEVIEQQINRICSHSDFWEKKYGHKLLLRTAVEDKSKAIKKMFNKEMSWDNIAYIGDAENDLECIKNAGFSGCPADAIIPVHDKALYPSDFCGGHGAVYDFAMELLEKRKIRR